MSTTTFRGYECSVRQAKACRYLERRGLMFCGHFGYENAIEIAESVRRARGGDELEQRLLGLRGIPVVCEKREGNDG